MSILKFCNHNKRRLSEMLLYMADPAKTSPALTIGLGVNPRYAKEEMEFANALWSRETNNTSYRHIILSFDQEANNLPLTSIMEIAEQVGRLFCTEHQVLATCHTDRINRHIHYLVVATNLFSGKQFRQQLSLFTYKQTINRILAKYGLQPIHCYTG